MSVRKWKFPYLRAFTLKFHDYDILHCPGIVFLDIQKKSQKKIGILISLIITLSRNCVPLYLKKVQKKHWYIDVFKMFRTCSVQKGCSLLITLGMFKK